jgi:hypothetical protein
MPETTDPLDLRLNVGSEDAYVTAVDALLEVFRGTHVTGGITAGPTHILTNLLDAANLGQAQETERGDESKGASPILDRSHLVSPLCDFGDRGHDGRGPMEFEPAFSLFGVAIEGLNLESDTSEGLQPLSGNSGRIAPDHSEGLGLVQSRSWISSISVGCVASQRTTRSPSVK